ncbi:MAG: ADP-ribosylation factor-like protein [Myxococcota bacterium]
MQVNPLTRELLVKLVYYGPGLGGKTTSLTCIHKSAPAEARGQIVSLATPVDRTLYFDFLPSRLAPIREHHIRLQLFTVPGQVYFNATRKLVLTGADGVVFVADSQTQRQDANLESLENLVQNLEEQERSLNDVPHVLQYNKRDLTDLLTLEELDRSLNARGAPSFPTSATEGEGVVDALDELVRLVVLHLESRGTFGEERRTSAPVELSRADDAFEEQIGRASEQIWANTVQRAFETRDAPEQPKPEIPPAPSFAGLFGEHREVVRDLERELARGKLTDAIQKCEQVALRILAEAAARSGLEAGRDPSTVALLLGVEGDRWLQFRRLIRRTRDRGPVAETEALGAYAMVIDLRLRAQRLLS